MQPYFSLLSPKADTWQCQRPGLSRAVAVRLGTFVPEHLLFTTLVLQDQKSGWF